MGQHPLTASHIARAWPLLLLLLVLNSLLPARRDMQQHHAPRHSILCFGCVLEARRAEPGNPSPTGADRESLNPFLNPDSANQQTLHP